MKNPLRWTSALALCLLLSGCNLLDAPGAAGAGGVVRPKPKVSVAGAQRAAAYSRSHGGISMIVAQRGTILLEQNSNKPVHIRSITKNFWAMALLAAEEDGFLDLDEPAAATLKEWAGDRRKSRVTLRQLMNQTAGLEPGFGVIYGGGMKDKYVAATRLPTRAEPGASFKYGPGHYEALGEILKRKLAARGMTPMGYMQGRVLAPLRIAADGWRSDRAGNYYCSAGADFTARDLLALGQMIERRGFAITSGQVISPFRMMQAEKPTEANPAYGLSFWLNQNASRADAVEVDYERILENGGVADWTRACASTLAPSDTIILVGSSGQRVYIIPSLDLVVVRQGSGSAMRDPEFLRLLLS
jgi:CubicO group peptidase (beta-lactamase class C family)